MLGKKGQISESMSWIVATLVIIVVLSISIAAAGGSDAVNKVVPGLDRSFKIKTTSDLLVTKSLTGFLQSDGNYKKIKDEDGYPKNPNFKFEDSMIELAENIFPVFYSGGISYNEGINEPPLWMGIVQKNSLFGSGVLVRNDQFKVRNAMLGEISYNKIKLNNDNYFELLVKMKNEIKK